MEQLKDILTFIAAADDDAASIIIQAIIRRYLYIHPGWEIIFLSLPTEDAALRRERIHSAFTLLQRSDE